MKLRLFFSLLVLACSAFVLPVFSVKAANITSIADLATSTATATPVVTSTPTAAPVVSATPAPAGSLANTGINLAAVLGVASLAMIALSAYQLLRRARY